MKKLDIILLALLILGLADALYLSLAEVNSVQLFCPGTGAVDCNAVISSRYSSVFGIPIAFASVVWFVVSIALLLAAIKRQKLLGARNVWFVLGIGAAIYSVLSMAAIPAICIYCALLDTVLVAITLIAIYGDRGR